MLHRRPSKRRRRQRRGRGRDVVGERDHVHTLRGLGDGRSPAHDAGSRPS
jgi:hypothetical protein